MKPHRFSLPAIYLTFFVDSLSWSIVYPIFAPYFLDPNNSLFSADVPLATRTSILGLFLMAFSLGQFLAAPLIGEYADRHGRKKALVWSVLFTFLGMALTAWSMQINSLFLLFLGRLITGIFASNMSICLACVTDLSENEQAKVKKFGYMSVLAGLSFVIGAFLGGKLSDPTIYPLFSPTFPLWLATFLTLINLLFVVFGFRETSRIDLTVKFDVLESFRNIKRALKTERIKRIYTIYFLFLFSWTMLFQFTPVMVVNRYSFTNSNIADLALFMGVCWAIGSSYLNKMLLRRFTSLQILEFCLLLFTVLSGLIFFTGRIWTTMPVLGLTVIIGGLAWPLCTGVISNAAPREMQGKILGISQSIQSLSMAMAPVIGGVAYEVIPGFPFLLGATASLLAGIIYFTLKDR
ncbi:MAG: MFS transporter [Verrucomicrobia bacterium]|nr:MFS transporter [Verrucomicrobiota bacterium]